MDFVVRRPWLAIFAGRGVYAVELYLRPHCGDSLMQGVLKQIAGRAVSRETYERFVARAALQQDFREVFLVQKRGSRDLLWDQCVSECGADRRVLFLEFGVFQGASARYFLKRFTNPATVYRGFDSFQGLPEDWGPLAKETFDVKGAVPDLHDSRARFVKGWFQNSFDAGIREAKAALPNPDAVFVHFDADLYSSTLFLLSKLHDEFREYYFLFDEFPGHEARALLNFQQAYGAKVEFLGWAGAEIPEQAFGRVINRKGDYTPPV